MREFEQKKPDKHSSSTFFEPKIQKKLTTGTVGDRYEVEADRVADNVVNKQKGGGLLQSRVEEGVQKKPNYETITKVQQQDLAQEQPLQKKEKEKEEDKKVQKKSDKEEDKKAQKKSDKEEDKKVQKKGEKEEDKKVQKKSDKEEDKKVQTKLSNTEPVNQSVENDLDSSKGSGTAMDKNTRREMESGFGSDFGKVNIHTDSKAIKMSEELGAQAFTHGNDIYFNNGKYNTDSKAGKHLLAHELTHTIQQTGGNQVPNRVQKQQEFQKLSMQWNINKWTTQKRQSNSFNVTAGEEITIKSNLAWDAAAKFKNLASSLEVNVYKKLLSKDSHEHHNIIELAGGSTSVSGLSEGTYYVVITLSEYNNDPENCSVNGSLTIDAT